MATLMDASHHRHPTSPEATPGRPRQHPRQWRFPNGLGSAAWHTMGGRSPHLVHSAKSRRTSTWWNAQQRRHAEPPAAKQQKGRQRLRWLKLCAPPPLMTASWPMSMPMRLMYVVARGAHHDLALGFGPGGYQASPKPLWHCPNSRARWAPAVCLARPVTLRGCRNSESTVVRCS